MNEEELDARIADLFDRLADLPEDQRAAALDAECNHDPAEARATLEHMLLADVAVQQGKGIVALPVRHIFGLSAGDTAPQSRESRTRTPVSSVDASRKLASPSPQQIGGYRVVQPLGSGGQGETWLVEEPITKRRVVLKRYHRTGSSAIDKLKSEAQALARVESPYVARCLHVDSIDEDLVLIMEYVHGDPINIYVRREQADFVRVAGLLRDVAQGLLDVHSAGLLHRDIKPSNILVRRNGTPCVVDFGLAVWLGANQPEQLAGTWAYMSPEQAREDSLKPYSDVFGLGAVMYHLLTGVPPYEGAPREIRKRAKRCQFLPPRAVKPAIPEQLEAICLKAMAANPAERFQTADTFRSVLQDYLSPRGIGPPAASPLGGAPHAIDFADNADEGVVAMGSCPYRGLESFRTEDADVYFGREDLIELALARIKASSESDDTLRFLAIIGASGSGKSSLARAGVIASLRRDRIEGSASWPVIACRPGHDALESLAVALSANPITKEAAGDVGALKAKLRNDSERLHLTTRLALDGAPEKQRVVVLVDQFEEIFRPGDEEAKQAFVANLLHAASVADGRTIVLITMRADFYAKASAYPDLAQALSTKQILVGLMTEQQRRSAIEEPGRLSGVSFQPGLVDMLIQDMKCEAGSLPFLQDALTQLWDRQTKGVLTIDDYKAIGRLEGAIEHRASDLYQSLNEAERIVCRRVFLRLTQPGEGTEDTKRRVHISELGDSDEVSRMIQKLAAARLITTEGESARGGPSAAGFVEVSHEAIIRGWSQLRAWIEEDRDSLRIQHQLTADAAAWKVKPDDAFLYRGTRLAVAEEWTKAHLDVLTSAELKFLEASVALRDSERHAKLAAANRLRRRAWAAGVAAILAISLAIVASFLWVDARNSAKSAQSAADEADRQRRVAESQRIALKAVEEVKVDQSNAIGLSIEALFTALNNHQPPPEATLDAFREIDNHIELASIQFALATAQDTTTTLVSGDGRWLISQSPDLQVHVWDLREPNSRRWTLRGHPGGIRRIWLTDSWLITMGVESEVMIWDMRGGRMPTSPQQIAPSAFDVRSLITSPNGRWLLALSHDSYPRLWDLHATSPRDTMREIMLTKATAGSSTFTSDYSSALFDSRGQWLAITGPSRQQVSIWKLTDSIEEVSLGSLDIVLKESEIIKAAFFTDNGRWLSIMTAPSISSLQRDLTLDGADVVDLFGDPRAVSDRYGSVGVWDLSLYNSESDRELSLTEQFPLTAYGTIVGVTYVQSIGDDRLLTFDGTTTKVSQHAPQGNVTKLQLPKEAPIKLSRSNRWLATHNGETIRVWDLANESMDAKRSQRSNFLHMLERPTLNVALTNNEQRLVTRSIRGNLRVWKIQAGEPTSVDLKLYDSPASAYFLSQNGRWLAATTQAGLLLWDLENAILPPRTLNQHVAPTQAVFFTSDSTSLITSDGWETYITSCEQPLRGRSFDARPDLPKPVDATPDGRLIAIADGESVTLCRLSEPGGNDAPSKITQKLTSTVVKVALSGDGSWLAAACEDCTIRLWQATAFTETGPAELKGHTGPVTEMRFLPSEHLLVSGSRDGTARLWRVDPNHDSALSICSHPRGVCSLAVSPDGKWFVSRGFDSTSRLWELRGAATCESFEPWSGREPALTSVQPRRTAWPRLSNKDSSSRLWNAGFEQLEINSRRIVDQSRLEKDFGLSAHAASTILASTRDYREARIVAQRQQRPKSPGHAAVDDGTVVLVNGGYKASWFPDNYRIAYGKTGGGIEVKDLRTGELTRLSERGKDPSVSPDGRYIACVDSVTFGDDEIYTTETIWLMTADGREVRKLCKGTWPVWSFDGLSLFYCSRDDDAVYKINPQTPDERVLFYKSPASEYFAVSPDETRIAYGARDGQFKIIDVSTRRISHAFWLPQMGYLPAWSPDSTRDVIAFGAYNGSPTGLLTFDLHDSVFRLAARGEFTLPAFSSDATRLAFDWRPASQDRVAEAAIHGVDVSLVQKQAGFALLQDITRGDLLSPMSDVRYQIVDASVRTLMNNGGDSRPPVWTEPAFNDNEWQRRLAAQGLSREPDKVGTSTNIRTVRYRTTFQIPDLSIVQQPLLAFVAKGHVKVFVNSNLVLEVGESANAPLDWLNYHALDADNLIEGHNCLAVEASSSYRYGNPLELFWCTLTNNAANSLESVLGNGSYPIGLRRSASRAFADMNGLQTGSLQALKNVLRDSDTELKRNAIRAICQLPIEKPLITAILLEVLEKERDDQVRKEAFVELGALGAHAKSAIPALGRMLQRGDAAAVIALVRIEPKEAVDTIARVDDKGLVEAEGYLYDDAQRILLQQTASLGSRQNALQAAETAERLNEMLFQRWIDRNRLRFAYVNGRRQAITSLAGERRRELREVWHELLNAAVSLEDAHRPHTQAQLQTMIGLGEYRIAAYDEAITVLRSAHNANGGDPATLAIMAMVLYMQGDADNAKGRLATAEQLVDADKWSESPLAKSLTEEAVHLLAASEEMGGTLPEE